ncbi:unnamed protein product [Schistosoma rodhaini]|nr:unnamed protein product [Schistosoma rodhaini]
MMNDAFTHEIKMSIIRFEVFLIKFRHYIPVNSLILKSSLILSVLMLYYLLYSSIEVSNDLNQFQTERYREVRRICEYLLKNKIVHPNNGVFERIQSHWNESYMNLSNHNTCEKFKLFQSHVIQSSMEEKLFPLAFSLSVHQNIKQVSRLLRLIYRSHNLYCIHVDSKSSIEFYNQVLELARCYGLNVMVLNRTEIVNIQWGYYSILEAFLVCADKLIKNTDYKWKYILNVNGQELPLRTNWELVAALKAINGSNVVEGIGPNFNPSRWPKKKFSFPIIWNKGSFYMALKREFVHFYQTDRKAKEILNAIKSERHLKKHPDEVFFPTLTHNPLIGAPGACNEIHVTNKSDPRKNFVARYVTWFHEGCKSSRVRNAVCIIGINDLPYITSRIEFFANKFHDDFEPIAYDCTEYYIMNKVLNEMKSKQLDPSFNVTPYSILHCSQNHI